jgi:serine/threonine protein kinase
MLITEYVPNGSLQSALLSDSARAVVICGVVLAMRHIHAMGIVHGDLKPANVLIDGDWCPRVCDFGAAVISGERAKAPVGSPAYMAPEMFNCEAVTEKADVFAFGMLLFEIVVGKPAFSPTLTAMQIMKKIFYREWPTIPHWVEPALALVIERCWEVKPKRRPSFDEILDALERMEFAILPGTDGGVVKAFVEKVQTQKLERGMATLSN